MVAQAAQLGATVTAGLVETLERDGALFTARIGSASWWAHSDLLATDLVNNAPAIAPEIHDAAPARGLLRCCPICDGYEVLDKRVP